LLVWIAAGAIAGALVAALRSPDTKELNHKYGGAIHIILCASTGAIVGSVIYVTLSYALYHVDPFAL